MKITKNFKQVDGDSFFRNNELSVCSYAINHLLGETTSNEDTIKLTLSTTNPKKKGFRTARCRDYSVYIGEKYFDLTTQQTLLFRGLDLNGGKPFWLKAENV